MTTCADLIHRAERLVYGPHRPQLNVLSAAVDGSVTAIPFSLDPNGVAAGTVIAVDLEDMLVVAVSGQTATVLRGFGGTTAAPHTSGSVVYVAPRWSKFDMFAAINDELADLSAPSNGLFAVTTISLVSSASQVTYDLAGVTDLLAVLRVQVDTSGADNRWADVRAWDVKRLMPTGEFSSGYVLRVYEPVEPGRALRVTAAVPFAGLAALSDDVTAVSGLPATAVDIPVLGAAMRLLAAGDSPRSAIQPQGDSRRADEVRVGDAQRAANGYAIERARRIAAEQSRLAQAWPHRKAI